MNWFPKKPLRSSGRALSTRGTAPTSSRSACLALELAQQVGKMEAQAKAEEGSC